MLRQTFILSALLLSAVALSAPIDVLTGVEVNEKNPGLAIASFSGPSEVGEALKRVLERCDWFDTQVAPAGAKFQIAATYQASPPQLNVQVRVRNGQGFTLTQPGVPGEPQDEVVYRAVDSIIKQIFKVPGPCAAPIAFAVGSSNQLKEVYVCRFDGTGSRRLTHNNSISTEPSWGPGNRTLVYTTYVGNATSVVLMDMVANRQRRLSRFRGLNAGADLSPDGQWAVLSLSQDKRVDLYLLNVESGKTRRLTNDVAVESSPCWSPSGREICYVSDRGGKPNLYRVSASGGSAKRVLGTRAETVSPDWSFASNKICFSRRMGSQYAVGVVDMATGKETILTRAAGDWESPSWAPDGRHIVCSRRLGAVRSLYMIDSIQGTLIPITRGGDHSLPSWGNPR
jgi:TolB protein